MTFKISPTCLTTCLACAIILTYKREFADFNVELRDFFVRNRDVEARAALVALQVGGQPVPLQLLARVQAVVDVSHTFGHNTHTHTHDKLKLLSA